MTPLHIALMLLANLTSGFQILSNKIGIDQFQPLAYAAARFFIVAVCLIPFIRWVPGRMREILLIALVTGVLHFGLMFVGLSLSDGIAAVAVASVLYAPFGALLAAIFVHERVGRARLIGLVLSFMGIIVIGFEPSVFERPLALILVVLGAFALGVGIVLVSRTHGVLVFTIQGWMALLAWPVLALLSFAFESDWMTRIAEAEPIEWGALAYTALPGTLIGHGVWYYLQRMYPVSVISPMFLLSTVIAVATGVVFLNEVLSWRFALGTMMTLIGVAVILRNAGKLREAPAATVAKTA